MKTLINAGDNDLDLGFNRISHDLPNLLVDQSSKFFTATAKEQAK